MSDSTSILDLPTDPVGGGNISNNINMKIQETSKQPQQTTGMSLDQTTISQIVNGLQQASLTGLTQLPSRDISMTTTEYNTDQQINPNYVPEPSPNHTDYIKNYEQSSDIVNDYNKNKQINGSLDDIYNEIQTPILVMVLYFLFQLPFFKKFLYANIPFLFLNDGNYNINGYLFTSIAFGMLFHFIIKTTSFFETF